MFASSMVMQINKGIRLSMFESDGIGNTGHTGLVFIKDVQYFSVSFALGMLGSCRFVVVLERKRVICKSQMVFRLFLK